MRSRQFAAGLATLLVLMSTRAVSAQSPLPESVRASAQRAAGGVLVVDVLANAGDTITVRLEAAELSFDRMRRQQWPAGGFDAASRTPRTTAQAGLEIARATFAALPSSVAARAVVVIVRSTDPQDDPSRVRLVYPSSELTAARGRPGAT